jgi:ABC-type polysaccharide transport system permease subunit
MFGQRGNQRLNRYGTPILLTHPFWPRCSSSSPALTGQHDLHLRRASTSTADYESRIDGVPPWARFWYLTVPMLKPVILFTTVISTIGTLQLFDEPYNITEGGPSQATRTLSYYIYDLTFRFMPSFGYSATVSWVIVVLVGILTLAQFVIARERPAR